MVSKAERDLYLHAMPVHGRVGVANQVLSEVNKRTMAYKHTMKFPGKTQINVLPGIFLLPDLL